MGNLDNCRCDARKLVKRDSGASAKNDFRWGGCSDNVDFAFNLARSFLDEREVGHDLRATINLHNNHIGRTVRASDYRARLYIRDWLVDRMAAWAAS